MARLRHGPAPARRLRRHPGRRLCRIHPRRRPRPPRAAHPRRGLPRLPGHAPRRARRIRRDRLSRTLRLAQPARLRLRHAVRAGAARSHGTGAQPGRPRTLGQGAAGAGNQHRHPGRRAAVSAGVPPRSPPRDPAAAPAGLRRLDLQPVPPRRPDHRHPRRILQPGPHLRRERDHRRQPALRFRPRAQRRRQRHAAPHPARTGQPGVDADLRRPARPGRGRRRRTGRIRRGGGHRRLVRAAHRLVLRRAPARHRPRQDRRIPARQRGPLQHAGQSLPGRHRGPRREPLFHLPQPAPDRPARLPRRRDHRPAPRQPVADRRPGAPSRPHRAPAARRSRHLRTGAASRRRRYAHRHRHRRPPTSTPTACSRG